MLRPCVACALVLLVPCASAAQRHTEPDPVITHIWTEATDSSQLQPLAHALIDSVGPRLTGSRGLLAAHDWAVRQYAEWGIEARNEQYGVWTGWRRGLTHVDMLQPRARTLEATLMAWSAGTPGAVEGDALSLPVDVDSAGFRAWLGDVDGEFVLISPPQLSCRPTADRERWATPEAFARMQRAQQNELRAWVDRVLYYTGRSPAQLPEVLAEAGAAGLLVNGWSGGWGTAQVHAAPLRSVPTLSLSCEDYGLLDRLASTGEPPRLRVNADAEFIGDVPAMNTIAEIRGRDRAGEYVVLSAHLDSWDSASGATDNGSGTIVVMEAMRMLKKYYPAPRRTIIAGHWGGEEQGLNGSRAFVADHPDVVRNLHVLLNQDSGTGRIEEVSMEGFTEIGAYFRQWLARMPGAVAEGIEVTDPGMPTLASSDHAAFVCADVPAFNLRSLPWSYGTYTWHTNRDTYDKLWFYDLRRNAAIIAMLAYLAAEERELLPRSVEAEAVHPATGVRIRRNGGCSPPTRG